MTTALPKFRSDLTISEQHTGNATVFVVKHPVTEQFFRFGQAERFIAQQFDGATTLDVVRQKVEGKFGAALPEETLRRFVNTLEKSGLLETPKTREKERTQRQRRVQGNLLNLRCKLLDPDRLFNYLIPKVRFFFTPYFLSLSTILIFAAVVIAITKWDDVQQDLSRLYSLSALPLISLIIFLVIVLHEFGHGLTCKHFGGEVHELGFLLIYFQPALYCNVSDAWLFPEKSKRLWVGFAGPYFELFLWALAVLIWRLTDVDTWINLVAFIVVTSSGIKTLFNLNPLVKLDGYYLLSDYLEIPNLRKRSFTYAGSYVKKLLGLAGEQAGEQAGELNRRERRISLAYGLVGSVSSFLILGYAMAQIGGVFLQQSQPMALALFVGLFGVKIRSRFQRMFGKSTSSSAEDLDDNSGVPEAAQSTEPKREVSKPRKAAPSSWRRPITAVIVTGATVAFLFLGHRELRIKGRVDVLPIHNADVRAEVEGIVKEILVSEGDLVHRGDPIARLSDLDLRAELQKTQAEIEQIRAKLKLLETGPTEEEIEVAKAAVAKAEDRRKYAQSRLVRDKRLFDEGLLSRKEFEDTQDLATAAENELAEARSKLKLLLRGNRPEEIDVNKAELERLESHRRYLEQQLQLLKVLSPAMGIVATPSRTLEEMRHQLVRKGDLIARVFDLQTVTAEIIVSEKDIADVKVGQKVLVKVRAYPDMTFQGTITSIATAAQMNSSSGAAPVSSGAALTRGSVTPKMVLVSTEIDNSSLLLKPEMTGQAKIFCGKRRVIDLVTRRLARTVKVEFWSWW